MSIKAIVEIDTALHHAVETLSKTQGDNRSRVIDYINELLDERNQQIEKTRGKR